MAASRPVGADDRDERVADLQFRNQFEYVVGHGIAAEPVEKEGHVVAVRSTWLPTATVTRVKTRDDIRDVTVAMEDLAALPDVTTARLKLEPLLEHYAAWIKDLRATSLDTDGRRETLQALVLKAERARKRIDAGIDLLARDPLAFDAFRIANRAMADAAYRRSPDRYKDGRRPEWRLFQLAFVLLSLPGLADETHEEVCASHKPSSLTERYLEDAACHGCLFVAECSCERFNKYLDRALVAPALGYQLPWPRRRAGMSASWPVRSIRRCSSEQS